MLEVPSLNRSEITKILPSGGEREPVVWTSSYFVCVVIVLTVVMPKTDLANLVVAAATERQKSAARAVITPDFFCHVMDVLGRRYLFFLNDKTEKGEFFGLIFFGDRLASVLQSVGFSLFPDSIRVLREVLSERKQAFSNLRAHLGKLAFGCETVRV